MDDSVAFYVERLREAGYGDVAEFLEKRVEDGEKLEDVFSELKGALEVIQSFFPRVIR